MTANAMAELRKARGESLAQFGVTLGHIMGRDRPYDKSSISKMESGQDAIPQAVQDALQTLGAMLDGVSPLQASTRAVQLYAAPDVPPGAFVLGHARQCANPGCLVVFVPAWPTSRYCTDGCRKAARKLRRKHA